MCPDFFLRPRLVGPRFIEHAIPLEFLKDLAALEEMISEIAKWKYHQINPGRKRTPRGFLEGVELKLIAIDDGSATPVIIISFATLALIPPNIHYFEEARNAIVYAIGAAERNEPIEEDILPAKTLVYFDRIGRSLRNDESIEFSVSTSKKSKIEAQLTRETRVKLIKASKAKEYTDDIVIRGIIPEADQYDMTFELQLVDGRKIKSPMTTQLRDCILSTFMEYKTGTHVLVKGVGKFSREGKLQSLESIEHINVLDPLDLSVRIDELRILKNGWLDGAGIAPKAEGLEWFENAFSMYYPDDLPLPYVYPTAEGGIQLEWSIKQKEISLEINLESKMGEWHCLNIETDADELIIYNLIKEDHWKRLVAQIEKLTDSVS